MRILVLKDQFPGETRVAATPDSVRKLIAAGDRVEVESGAGVNASIPDPAFAEAGATIISDRNAALGAADLVLSVREPGGETLAAMKKGAGLCALLNPWGNRVFVDSCAKAGISAFALEFVPRITRAQAMDVLSSQANLAGYRAVVEAATLYGRAFPMMMTAAGTVAAAKCFVMGAGVAGLQAIATARRLGAQVTATDVRPAAKEQVLSLGAKFIAVEDDEFRAAETTAGYAKPMSAEYQAKQAALVAEHIAKQDIVITTALIPGRPAPILISAEMVAKMKPGSVIIDLAAAQGGNCAATRADETVRTDGGVLVAGFSNLPGRIAADSSALLAKNLLNLVPLLRDKESGAFSPAWNDEIIKGCALTNAGAIVHPAFALAPAVA